VEDFNLANIFGWAVAFMEENKKKQAALLQWIGWSGVDGQKWLNRFGKCWTKADGCDSPA